MPELPEVETVVRQLAPLLQDRRIRRLEVFDDLLAVDEPKSVRNARILAVTRLGKQILLELAGPRRETPRRWLCVHLRMTGRLVYQDAPPCRRARHLRAQLLLDRGSLCFFDPRRFGMLAICTGLEAITPRGLDPLSPRFTAGELRQRIGTSRQAIKVWLLRQDRLVGLGNIYASETLFAARLDPRRPAHSLDPGELRRLHRAIRAVLRRAIAHCGTTFSDFQDAHGIVGSFQRYLAVYGREGGPCPRCGRAVARLVQQQRSTFWCPRCQT